MRRLLAERAFPVDEIRYFASARSAGHDAAVERRRDHRRGRRDRRPDRPRHRPVLRRRHVVAGAGPAVRRRRRHGDRQLVGVADGPRRAARRQRGQPGARSTTRRKGIIANPNCTTMAAMPVLKPLHDEAGLVRLIASTLPGGVGRRARPASTSSTSRSARSSTAPRELTHDGAAVDVPGAREVRQADRLQRAAVRRQARRRRLVRDRRGAEAPQREPQDPRHPRPRGVRHVRAGARCSPATRCRSTPSSPGRSRSSEAVEVLAAAPGRRRSATSRRRSRRPARTPATSGASAVDPTVDGGRGLALFVSNDNLRKGAALNAVQIAELLLG